MSSHVEDSIELRNARDKVAQLVRVLPERRLLVEELGRDRVVLEHLHGAGVEWSFASFGRGDDQLSFVVQNLPGMGEFRLCMALVAGMEG